MSTDNSGLPGGLETAKNGDRHEIPGPAALVMRPTQVRSREACDVPRARRITDIHRSERAQSITKRVRA